MKNILVIMIGICLLITSTPFNYSVQAEEQEVQKLNQNNTDNIFAENIEANENASNDESIISQYGHFSMEQVTLIKGQFSPTMLMVASYYYPELTHLLNQSEIQVLLTWNEIIIRSMIDQMNNNQIEQLQTITPLVIDHYTRKDLSVTSSVYGLEDTFSSVTNSVYGKTTIQKNSLMAGASSATSTEGYAYSLKDASFNFKQSTEGDVDPNLRAFHQRDVDVYLPGREGLDLSIARSYSSNNSFTWDPYYGCRAMTYCNFSDIDNISDDLNNLITSYEKDVNYIASGWSLNIPTMSSGNALNLTTRFDDKHNSQPPWAPGGAALYTNDKGGVAVEKVSVTIEDGTTYMFSTSDLNKSLNHPYEDVRLVFQEYNNETRKYESRLYINNEKVTYVFDEKNRIIAKVNAFGDKVSYEYVNDSIYNINITDSLNQKININRDGSDDTTISVYNSSSTLIKKIVYDINRVSSSELLTLNDQDYGISNDGYRRTVITYNRLSSVTDTINNKTLKTYTYYEPSASTVVDFNLEDDWIMAYDGSSGFGLEIKDTDGTGVESEYIDRQDLHSNGEALSLLLKEVRDDTGFTTTVQYTSYDKNWESYPTFKERNARRGTVRQYLDGYLLQYIGYLPVVNVFYSYKNSDGINKTLQMSVTADNPNKANEIWTRPKARITESPFDKFMPMQRYEAAGAYRSGDKINNTFTYYYGDYIQKTSYAYSATKLGQFQLDSVTNETVPLTNGINLTDGGLKYSYAPKQTISYQYDEGKTKPYLTKTFGDGATDDTTPASIKDFLRYGKSRTLPSNLEKYSSLVKQEYDQYGNVVYQEDEIGNKSESQYNGPFHQVSYVKQTSSDGLSIIENTLSYNADGTVNKIIQVSSYRDPNNINQTLQDSITTEYPSYTSSKLPTRIIVRSSGAQYSANANVTDTTLEYDSKLQHVKKETIRARLSDGQNYSTISKEYAYDDLDRLQSVTFPDYSQAVYTYDYKDRVKTDTFVPAAATAASRTTSYYYDDYNRTVYVTAPDGERIATQYTPYGEVDKQIRENGPFNKVILKNETDSSGVLTKAVLPYNDAAQKTSYVYGANGQVSQETNPIGTTSYYYSNAAYSLNGSAGSLQQTVKVVEPDGKETWTYNDKYGRNVKVEEKSPTKSRVTTYAYTPFGFQSNMTVMANGKTQSTNYAYDAIGNLINVRDSLGQHYDYGYNSAGQVTTVKINGTTKTTNVFNEIGKLIKKTNAEDLSEFYSYKPNGLLDKFMDKRELIHTPTYTDYNEISRESVKNVLEEEVYWRSYEYDQATRLLTGITTSENESQTYHYDEWKRLDHKTVAGRPYTMGYDSYDRLNMLLYPDNKAVTYSYDNANRIKTVGYLDMGTVTYNYEVGNDLNKYTITYPGGMNQVKSHNAFDELTSVKHNNSGGTSIWTETFGYDGMGNIQNIVKNGVSTDYQYDNLNRIKQEKSATATTDYDYDAFGNITTIESSNSSDEFVAMNQSYSYNALNQLSSFSTDTLTANYTYYGDGLRATKTVNGVKTRYVYLNGRVIEELDANGNSIGRNIWGNELLFRKDAIKNKAGFYMYNGHGDVVAIRDYSGDVLNSYDYDIWGKVTLLQEEQMSNPFKYTGEIYDEESGLIYLRARYYDPIDKRFINEDTYEGDLTNPLTLNLYTYVLNNPLIYTDPSGMCVAGKDDGCYVDSYSDVDRLIDDPQLSNNTGLWWDIQFDIQNYCDDSACVAEQKAEQKILEQSSDAIRNNACSYVDCTEGEGKFIGTGTIQYTVDGQTVNYAVTPGGLFQCNCFTAGTTVLTDEGEKPIEEIQLGDQVLAKNDKTGEVSYQEVELLFRKTVEETFNITVNGEVITTTAEHPFWIVGKGWVKAKDLLVGEQLVTSEDVQLVIEEITVKKEHRTVYNFRVKNDHTYFVSNLNIWTHNEDSCGSLLGGTANYQVYYGYNNNKIVYVGITNNFARRKSEHGDRFDDIRLAYDGYFTKWQARGLEQYNIDEYGMQKNGGQLENKQNSISVYRTSIRSITRGWVLNFIKRK